MRFGRSIHAVSLRERIVFISDLLRFFSVYHALSKS